MDSHRRHVLGVLGSGLGVGLAGCLSRAVEDDGSGRLEPSAEPVPQQDVASDIVDEAASDDDATSELAETTDRIMDELAWFATEYTDAIRAYREAGEDVLAVVRDVGASVPLTPTDVDRLDGEFDRPAIDQGWPYDYDSAVSWDEDERLWRYIDVDWPDPDPDAAGEPPLTDEDLERLREVTHAFAETFEAELEPHFHGAKKERAFADEAVGVLERFTEYEDTAMVVAGLLRLYHHYQTLIGAEYVEEHLSSDPIRNRLAEYLLSESGTGSSFPLLFEIDYQGRNSHTAFAYADHVDSVRRRELHRSEPVSTIDGSSWHSSGKTLQEVTIELTVETDRTDHAYLVVNDWRRVNSDGYAGEHLPSGTIYVQRYHDAQASERALEALFDAGTVTPIDIDPIQFDDGTIRYLPVRFVHDGEPWYAALAHAGRVLVTFGLAKRPFEHRTEEAIGHDWTRQLTRTWLHP